MRTASSVPLGLTKHLGGADIVCALLLESERASMAASSAGCSADGVIALVSLSFVVIMDPLV